MTQQWCQLTSSNNQTMKNIIKGLTLALPFSLLSCGPVSSDVEQETEKRVEVSCAKLSRKKSKESVDEINDLKLLFELAKGGDTPSCVAAEQVFFCKISVIGAKHACESG